MGELYRQDEAIEQSFYQPPYPRLNLPGGNRWVRPYPASSTWPYLGWDDG